MTLIDGLGALFDAIKAWQAHSAEASQKRKERVLAIDAVERAALATKAYLHDVKTSVPNRGRELSLYNEWHQAASAIEAYDPHLFEIARMKAIGWADPASWADLPVDPAKLKIDLILKQCEWLRQN